MLLFNIDIINGVKLLFFSLIFKFGLNCNILLMYSVKSLIHAKCNAVSLDRLTILISNFVFNNKSKKSILVFLIAI